MSKIYANKFQTLINVVDEYILNFWFIRMEPISEASFWGEESLFSPGSVTLISHQKTETCTSHQVNLSPRTGRKAMQTLLNTLESEGRSWESFHRQDSK